MTSINDVLSVLHDKKIDLKNTMKELDRSANEIEQRKRYAEGNLYEVEYLINYIEKNEPET
jgi:hypothetical protein